LICLFFGLCPFLEYCLLRNRDYYILIHEMFVVTMFGKQKGKPKMGENEKPQTTKKSSREAKSPNKIDQLVENTAPLVQSNADVKAQKNPLVTIKEYSSAMKITEKIDKEIDETKTALGQYIRQLEDTKYAAEQLDRLHNVVAKATGKKIPKENPNQLEVNGLEIILNATPLHELAAIETVVRNRQERLLSLQKVKESLGSLDSLCETEGLKYLVLEREGIPEQILLRTS